MIRAACLVTAWFVAALLWASPVAGATALRVVGGALTEREVRALAGPALGTPGDSAAVRDMLGRLIGALQERGHLDARARAVLDTVARTPRLTVTIIEGPRVTLGSLAIDAPDPADSARIAGALPLAAGVACGPRAIGDAVSRALGTLAERGHAYARLGVTAWERQGDSVAVRIGGAPGPLVTVRRVRVDGASVTRPVLLARVTDRLVDRPYRPTEAAAVRERLEQLGLFTQVTLEPLEGGADWRDAEIAYRVTEPRYNRFDGVVGVQGASGTVGRAELELGNVLGTGRQIALLWQSRGAGLTDLASRYAEPLLFGLPLSLHLGIEQQVQDTLYIRTRWGGRLRWLLTGRERIEAGLEMERVVQEAGAVEEAEIQSTVFAIERSTLDRPLGPRRGIRARAEAAQIWKRERLRPAGTRSSAASAADLSAEWHRPVGVRSVAAIELRAAGRFSSERVLPVFERTPLGGAASLRGYDEEAFRVDRYALSRLEWRWFVSDGADRVFAFWDHAWMATREGDGDGDRLDVRQRDGVGVGLRLGTRGGIVGIDYGIAPGTPALEGKIHLRLVSLF